VVTLDGALDFSYESDLSKSYVVAKVLDKDRILDFQVEMLTGNNIAGILNFDLRYSNGDTFFYYDITSKLALSQYIRRKTKKAHIIRILASVCDILTNCRGYLLSDKNFLFDGDYIFINPSTLEVFMVYIPIKTEEIAVEKLRRLISYIAVNSNSMESEDCHSVLYHIVNFCRGDAFNTAEFSRFLKGLASGNNDMENTECRNDPNNLLNKKNERLEKVSDSIQTDKREKSEKRKEGKSPKQGRVLLCILLQVLILTAVSLVVYISKPIHKNSVSTYAGIGMIAGAIDMLAVRWLLKGRRDSTLKKREEKPLRTAERHSRKAENIVQRNDTILLQDSNCKYPCLKCLSDGINEEIKITKSGFVIGRLKDQVDHVMDNKAVGKVHAVITEKDGEYYIKDLNSRNGTYINNTRIECNKEFPVKNGDTITIANRDYMFIACTRQ
jgi:hypothetical protein